MSTATALLVAAGRGTRFGGALPKQYRRLAGQAVLRHSVRAFLDHPVIDRVIVVIDPACRDLYDAAVGDLPLDPPVDGGDTRQDSVRRGLEALAARPPEPARVLIHDAARPLVDADTIAGVVAALDAAPGAIAAVPVADTLKRAVETGTAIADTVDRTGLWRAQTPQGFRFRPILEAHRTAAGGALTDDAAVAEAAGLAVRLVPSTEENFKVTTEADLDRAEALLAAKSETRTGTGFDVHRFGPGDHVMLCGIALPHDRGLLGHSDADVGLHALTDAILGAIAAGDIGQHFPPTDPQWKGAASDAFLRHAGDLVAARGGRIVNLDVTLICERPKVGPHRPAMAGRIAAILDLPVDRVGVKATTTEGLGFPGRGEGIAAQAVATVALPR
jgi:2-C-methyl-D-erythritol 4-phosphate cytidylyltransferase/2-C-methyl-D-erythritol 2,4-cyclodiphosphate synthase